MRIALVQPYSLSVPGGVQGQVLGLARSLRQLGVDARVIGPCDGPPPEPGVVTVGTTLRVESNGSISPVVGTKVAQELTIEALRDFDPDVVHLHEPFIPGPTIAALLGWDGPKVGTFHAAADETHPAYKALKKVGVRVARRLLIRIAVSEDARHTAEAAVGGSYIVLPNGVEIDRFAKVAPWPTDRVAVLFLGRHEPRKGLGVVLDAWTGIDRDAVLWVVGDGPESDALQARRTPNVEWLGRVDDNEKARRLRAATVFCAPALRQESFGVVLLEAMAAGTAVVAADIPGYRNVARPDREALMFPAGDSESLRSVLRRALDADVRRAELVEAGEQRVAEFSMHRLAERYLTVYETAIELSHATMPSSLSRKETPP